MVASVDAPNSSGGASASPRNMPEAAVRSLLLGLSSASNRIYKQHDVLGTANVRTEQWSNSGNLLTRRAR